MGHLTLAGADLLDDATRKIFGDEDGEAFNRLAFHVVDVFHNNLGLTKLELVALAAHGLDEDAEVQDAATVDHQ